MTITTEQIERLIAALEENNRLKVEEISHIAKLQQFYTGEKPKTGFDVDLQQFILVSPRRNKEKVLEVDGEPSEHTSVTGKLLGLSLEESVYKDKKIGSGKYQMMFANLETSEGLIKLKVGRSNQPAVHTKSILLALLEMTDSQQELVTFAFAPADSKESTAEQVVLVTVIAKDKVFYNKHPKGNTDEQEAEYWSGIWDALIHKYNPNITSKIKADKNAATQEENKPVEPPKTVQSKPKIEDLTGTQEGNINLVKNARAMTELDLEATKSIILDITDQKVSHPAYLTQEQTEQVANRMLWTWYYHNIPGAKGDPNGAYTELKEQVQRHAELNSYRNYVDRWLDCIEFIKSEWLDHKKQSSQANNSNSDIAF